MDLLSDVTDVTLARWLAIARAVRRDAGELIKVTRPAPGSIEATHATAVEALLEQLLTELGAELDKLRDPDEVVHLVLTQRAELALAAGGDS